MRGTAGRVSPSTWLWGLIVALVSPGIAAAAFDRTHATLDGLLRRHVEDGRADYAALVEEARTLGTYLDSLEVVAPAELGGWPRDDQLAFWINAYNAFVLMSVVQHYPLSRHTLVGLAFPANSIWQVPDVWKDRRWSAAGRMVSLDIIEHEIIRPVFREPRVHFALVCAARSCPNLRSEAYRGDRLDSQLEDQARHFLANPHKGLLLDRERGKALVSKIFDWYGVDFAPGPRPASREDIEHSILQFIANRSPDAATGAFLLSGTTHLGYLTYDWTLNDRHGDKP
jgi:hypothetical protein